MIKTFASSQYKNLSELDEAVSKFTRNSRIVKLHVAGYGTNFVVVVEYDI